jgi:hypothetical protein
MTSKNVGLVIIVVNYKYVGHNVLEGDVCAEGGMEHVLSREGLSPLLFVL